MTSESGQRERVATRPRPFRRQAGLRGLAGHSQFCFSCGSEDPPAPEDMLSVDAIDAMSVAALKRELRDWGLDLSGRKADLRDRLQQQVALHPNEVRWFRCDGCDHWFHTQCCVSEFERNKRYCPECHA